MQTRSFVEVVEDNDPRLLMQKAALLADPTSWENEDYLSHLEGQFEDPEFVGNATPLERELFIRFAALMDSYKRLEREFDEEFAA